MSLSLNSLCIVCSPLNDHCTSFLSQWFQHHLDRGDENIQACVDADHVVSESVNLHFNPQCSSHPNLNSQIPFYPLPYFLSSFPSATRSVLQSLHGCCERAVKAAVIPGSGLEWARHYQQQVESDRSCLNEWEALNELESVRKDSEGLGLVE